MSDRKIGPRRSDTWLRRYSSLFSIRSFVVRTLLIIANFAWLLMPLQLFAADDIRELKLRDWEPKSMLVTKTTVVEKPRFPVIDIHNHLGGGRQFLSPERVRRYLTEMDEAGVHTVVNLDGGWGPR